MLVYKLCGMKKLSTQDLPDRKLVCFSLILCLISVCSLVRSAFMQMLCYCVWSYIWELMYFLKNYLLIYKRMNRNAKYFNSAFTVIIYTIRK
jgi:hypothetical protein